MKESTANNLPDNLLGQLRALTGNNDMAGVGRYLTQGAMTELLEALDQREDLERQLAAMTAARDEACELATTHLPEDRQRILELRRVGRR